MNQLLLGLMLTQVPATLPELPQGKWMNANREVKLSDYKGKVVILQTSPGFC